MHPRICCDHPCPVASQPQLSPLPELLASNDVPSDIQTATILDTIQKAKTELARVEATLANLTAQRAELHNFIRDHTSVVSSLRRFPNELLSEIFRHCVDWEEYLDPLTNGSWTVARVCRRWREVALSCPSLWTHFIVPTSCSQHTARLLKVQLDRARLAPLCIQLPERPAGDAILGLFLQVAPQWEEIEFRNRGDFVRFATQGTAYPQLRKLRLNTRSDPVSSEDLLNHDLASSFPALVHLYWNTSYIPLPRQLSSLWPRLRTLVLRSPDLPEALRILSLLSPGTDVSLSSGIRDAETECVKSQIQSFRLKNCFESFAAGLLKRLVAPALKQLLLEKLLNDATVHRVRQFPLCDILSFLSNSACSLKYLRVVGCDSRSLIEILEAPGAREIVWLEVSLRDFDVFIEALAEKDTLVPRLRTLAVRGKWEQVDVSGILVNRRASLRNLRFSSAFGDWDYPDNKAGDMDSGLDVVVLRPPY